MPDLKDLSYDELAFLLLLRLWSWLDAGGFSNGRSEEAVAVEGITRGRLLAAPEDLDFWRSTFCEEDILREAARRPIGRRLMGCDFNRPLSRYRNRELLAVLLRWLLTYYRNQSRRENYSTRNHDLFRAALKLLYVPRGTPLFPLDALAREMSRRASYRCRRRNKKFLE